MKATSSTTAISTTASTATSGAIVLLTRLSRVVYRRSGEELLGISLKYLAALAYLRDHADTTQQALTEGLCVDANYCVLLLNDLEAAGFAERRRDPADRRRHLVTMTEAGRAALEHAERAQESVEDEILAGLTPQQRASLAQLLRQALDNQNGRPPDPQDTPRSGGPLRNRSPRLPHEQVVDPVPLERLDNPSEIVGRTVKRRH